MIVTFLPLFADTATRTVFEWGRIRSNADWILPLTGVVALIVFARYMIRLDAREARPAVGWLLTALRIGAIACLLVIYLQPQWRSEREVARNSRALLLLDTSSSMGLADAAPSAGSGGAKRIENVAAALERTDFLSTARKTHDVIVLRFDEDIRRVISLEKLTPEQSATGLPKETRLPNGENAASPADRAARASGPKPGTAGEARIDWKEVLAPTGTQTRLGQALRQLVSDERGSPVSGVVVVSDGGQNAGISPEAAIEAAQEARIPIFTVGVGSTRKAVNVRVARLEVPPRAHPGDPYSVAGLIQAQGLAGEAVSAQLLIRTTEAAGDPAQRGSGVPVGREDVVLGGDGELVPVKFELTPSETGRQTICLRVEAPQADADPNDDYQEEEIEIVDRKLRAMLVAGGPTREYRFLRNQLSRDASTTVDVLLQTARPGVSQEADQILDAFPATAQQMYAYDCVVAFDPDWQELTLGQIDLLESWVAEQGGGLIVIPGPVYAGEPIGGWVEAPGLSKLRALYPVEFQRRLSVFETVTYVSKEPWALDFTREGLEAEFLWLGDTATASQRAWGALAGVYSYFPVAGPKPGATVLACFSDPRAGQGEQKPVYLAEQFYGSGRVFYLGSGEMWRLRGVEAAHFERFYTNVIRHVCQGRLLRQSSRGALMVGQDRHVVGNTVEIRARLTDAKFAPLEAAEVLLEVAEPGGHLGTVTLRPDPNRVGMFAGQLTVLEEGTYRLHLPVPESDGERLTRRVKVSLPDLEREDPQRNDKLLSRIAQATGGKYYDDLQAALSSKAPDPLVRRLKDRTKTVIQTGSVQPPSLGWLLERCTPRGLWQQTWFSRLVRETWLRALLQRSFTFWLMILLCSLLCGEWLIRRLSKLA